MSSSAISSVGTRFRRWDRTSTSSGESWADLAEVISITGPGMSRDTIDVTSLASTGGYREFIAGFRDGGTVKLTMNFVAADYALMKADFEMDDLQNYEIVLPDTALTSLEFEGLVTELPLSIPTGDRITADVTIKISGQVTVNAGVSSGL